MKTLALAALLFALLAPPALAEAAGPEAVAAKSGQEVRVGWIGSVGADCQPNPAPTVTPAQLAAHGQIRLVQAEVETNSFPACPGVKLPVVAVFYTSAPGFKGTDGFTLTPAGGAARAYSIAVE